MMRFSEFRANAGLLTNVDIETFFAGAGEVASHLIGGYTASEPKEFASLAPGDAAILKVDGDTIVALKGGDGRIHAVSAACTHMGCLVGWKETDRTWGLPLHGSRFTLSGEVMHGPAVQRLKPYGPDRPSGLRSPGNR